MTPTQPPSKAQVDVSVAFEALSAFAGERIAAISPLLTAFPVVAPVPAARHDWVESALQNNPGLRAAKLSATAARQQARASISAHLPTVSASYSYAERSDTNTDLAFPGSRINEDLRIDEQGVAAIQLDVPIFSGMRVSGERRRDIALKMQSQDLYYQAQRDITEAARSLHVAVTVGVTQVTTRKQAIASNQRALDATQAGYKAGTRNLVDVLVAQRSLSQAQRKYYAVLYDYILKMLRLKEVAGTLSPEDIVQLNSWLESGMQTLRNK